MFYVSVHWSLHYTAVTILACLMQCGTAGDWALWLSTTDKGVCIHFYCNYSHWNQLYCIHESLNTVHSKLIYISIINILI